MSSYENARNINVRQVKDLWREVQRTAATLKLDESVNEPIVTVSKPQVTTVNAEIERYERLLQRLEEENQRGAQLERIVLSEEARRTRNFASEDEKNAFSLLSSHSSLELPRGRHTLPHDNSSKVNSWLQHSHSKSIVQPRRSSPLMIDRSAQYVRPCKDVSTQLSALPQASKSSNNKFLQNRPPSKGFIRSTPSYYQDIASMRKQLESFKTRYLHDCKVHATRLGLFEEPFQTTNAFNLPTPFDADGYAVPTSLAQPYRHTAHKQEEIEIELPPFVAAGAFIAKTKPFHMQSSQSHCHSRPLHIQQLLNALKVLSSLSPEATLEQTLRRCRSELQKELKRLGVQLSADLAEYESKSKEGTTPEYSLAMSAIAARIQLTDGRITRLQRQLKQLNNAVSQQSLGYKVSHRPCACHQHECAERKCKLLQALHLDTADLMQPTLSSLQRHVYVTKEGNLVSRINDRQQSRSRQTNTLLNVKTVETIAKQLLGAL